MKSQSLNTDQGNSDHKSRPWPVFEAESLNPSIQIRAIRTGSLGKSIHGPVATVSIPQYRSGQFGQARAALEAMAVGAASQSLNTDQGNSDSGPPRLLIINHLAGHLDNLPKRALPEPSREAVQDRQILRYSLIPWTLAPFG